jgi:UDP-N-acetylglucosamine--N-acetylmuramyl-(pentapeptide) pyrophosphoryl-undecaprenol N-acetylglucosamine transferase
LILLSVGTHRQSFSRALDLIEPLARQGTTFVVQHGSTPPRPELPNTTWVELIAFDELVDTIAKADSVVCHAGVGTIMTALQAGHTPVVIPRQARHGEHVDDHQIEIANHFAERGLVRCVVSETDLAPLLTTRGDGSDGKIGKGGAELRAVVSRAVVAEPRRRLRYRSRKASLT